MTDKALRALSASVGLATDWLDFKNDRRDVSPEVLRAVLRALDLPADTASELKDSQRKIAQAASASGQPLLTATAGRRFDAGAEFATARWIFESGKSAAAKAVPGVDGNVGITAPATPGYHLLEAGDRSVTVAVAPRRGWRIPDVAGDARVWGLAAQIYSLRDGETEGFGDFAALGRFAGIAAAQGADAVAVSPIHALFAADPGRYGPYAPSTRLFLNVLYGDPGGSARGKPDTADLVDWKTTGAMRLKRLRQAYERFRDHPGDDKAAFDAFVTQGGERLLGHARFEALDARFRPRDIFHWREWPDGFADASSTATRGLRPDDPEVEIHLYFQFLAERGLAAAQREASVSGMRIGLIADLAVGMDGAGSHAWSAPTDVLTGVSVGAPPDLLGPEGQNWGLTALSPTGLAASGFGGFLETLRTAMRNAGGVRIDHAMGLRRLWVVPDGAKASEGTYLSYPFEDLLRLTALESHRNKAIVIGEDLGTVPPGFREATTDAGIMGMRVLWFERTRSNRFRAPSTWGAEAVAMSTTHDLPTIAGWWRERDIDWRLEVGGDAARATRDRNERATDRAVLWSALRRTGCAEGQAPDIADPAPVIDGALKLLGGAPCRLAIIPAEDVFGLVEQPNLPGTIDEHPNWRRRLPPSETLAEGDAANRLAILNQARTE
jgi:4-alpha-glucanotransferase